MQQAEILRIFVVFLLSGATVFRFQNQIQKLFEKIRYRLSGEILFTVSLATSVLVTVALVISIQLYQKVAWINAILNALEIVFQVLEGNSTGFLTLAEGNRATSIIAHCLAIIVPISTAGTIFVFLSRCIPRPIPLGYEYCIFSELDNHSILLATDIQKNTKSSKIVFIFLRTRYGQAQTDTLLKLKELRYCFYPHTESELLMFHRRLRKQRLRFFFLSEHTDTNFARLKLFLQTVEERKLFCRNRRLENRYLGNGEYLQELYLLSETTSAPMLIDDLRKNLCELSPSANAQRRKAVFCNTELRLLDRYRSVCYHQLKNIPLYRAKHQDSVRILVLGFGRMGQEFFRAAISFCAMKGCKTSFCLCDQDIETHYDSLIQQYPQCRSRLTVNKHSINIESKKLTELLDRYRSQGTPFTYIVVALGDDEKNIKIAAKLKRYYRMCHWIDPKEYQPIICVNIEDEIKSQYSVRLLASPDGADKFVSYIPPLHVYGTDAETFSVDVLMPQGIWTAAERLHTAITGNSVNSLPLWPEYERRSSIASVSHAPYHLAVLTDNFEDDSYELTYAQMDTKEKDAMITSEHERWMHYVRCEGMQRVGLDIVSAYHPYTDSHVDVKGQLSPCLVSAHNLTALYKEIRTRFPEYQPKYSFRQRDELVVKNALRFYRISNGKDPEMKLLTDMEEERICV